MGCKLSLVLPSYGRRELTGRAVRSVFAQAADFSGAEVFFFGDGCPVYREITASPWFIEGAAAVADRIRFVLRDHAERDGTPTRILNEAVEEATGDYFCFMANDDRLLPGHFAGYHGFAASHDADLAYFDSTIEIGDQTSTRRAGMQYGCIGHAEIVVRTGLAKSVQDWNGRSHHRGYGHDWDFVRAVVARARPERVLKGPNAPTYRVNMGPREHVYQEGTV